MEEIEITFRIKKVDRCENCPYQDNSKSGWPCILLQIMEKDEDCYTIDNYEG